MTFTGHKLAVEDIEIAGNKVLKAPPNKSTVYELKLILILCAL